MDTILLCLHQEPWSGKNTAEKPRGEGGFIWEHSLQIVLQVFADDN